MELKREKCCCFTGHRRLSPREKARLRPQVRTLIRRLCLERGVHTFLAGGALGFDTLAAQQVMLCKEQDLLPVNLVLVLPCLEQSAKWPLQDSVLYEDLIARADEVIYTGDLYTPGCLHRRNRYLVDHSAICAGYLKNGSVRSGTGYTVQYAAAQGLEIINLAEPQQEGDKPNGTATDKMPWGRGPL